LGGAAVGRWLLAVGLNAAVSYWPLAVGSVAHCTVFTLDGRTQDAPLHLTRHTYWTGTNYAQRPIL